MCCLHATTSSLQQQQKSSSPPPSEDETPQSPSPVTVDSQMCISEDTTSGFMVVDHPEGEAAQVVETVFKYTNTNTKRGVIYQLRRHTILSQQNFQSQVSLYNNHDDLQIPALI